MENNNYKETLKKIIPGGAHTYSRGDDQYPSNAPSILERGKDAYVWDPSGNRYLDYGMALRAVTLGYANERVNKAAFREIEKGVNLTRATTIELEAAQAMVDLRQALVIGGANRDEIDGVMMGRREIVEKSAAFLVKRATGLAVE